MNLQPSAFSLWLLLAAGCTAPSGTSSMPKPGSGIAEYREVARQAHKAVARTVDSLEALGSRRGHEADRQLAGFDRAFNELELTSIKARARAEAIIARGQSYFDEWKEHLAGAANEPSAQADYNRLYDHFTRVRQRSGEVREEFRPFMTSLRQFRARLSPTDPIAKASSGSPGPVLQRDSDTAVPTGEIQTLAAAGRRVLKSLESVSAALDDAEAELKTVLASKR